MYMHILKFIHICTSFCLRSSIYGQGLRYSLCNTPQHITTHCNTLHCYNSLQHTATPYITLHHTVSRCNTLQHTATHLYQNHQGARAEVLALQHTATPWNSLQDTVSYCITLQHAATHSYQHHWETRAEVLAQCQWVLLVLQLTASHSNTLHHTATHCNTLVPTSLRGKGWGTRSRSIGATRSATHCNTLQHPASRCNTLQHARTNIIERQGLRYSLKVNGCYRVVLWVKLHINICMYIYHIYIWIIHTYMCT